MSDENRGPKNRELVVFLPAVGGDRSFWQPQLDMLADEYHTLALDLNRPADQVSMGAFGDDVAAAIRESGFERAHVVGLSMGGVVALDLFKNHRALVRSLTLANSWAYQAEGAGKWAWARGELETKSLAEFSRATLPALFAPATDRTLVEYAISVESAKDKAAYGACWREMLTADYREVLSLIDVPVLLIGGELDEITPTDPLLSDIAAAVPTARLVKLVGASHFSNLDQPDAFTGALRSHLRSARSTHGDDLNLNCEKTFDLPASTTAEQLLRILDRRGVEVFISNSGTDFTPLIDALAHLADDSHYQMRLITAAHENTAIAVAHGHSLLSRRPQAVMAHVGVGTANMGLGLMNARRARIPMLVMAGRTPWYEQGMVGVRSNFVQWGQDTFDQGGYFREFTKWDYELKGGHALDTVLDRAMAIAASDPAGPVYLTLPKEPLCSQAPARAIAAQPRQMPASGGGSTDSDLARAIHAIGKAKLPLIVTADLGRHAGGAEVLCRFAEAAGAGVVEHGKRNFFNFPTHHPHHLGFDPHPLIADADLVIAVECPVPWIPAFLNQAIMPVIIQIGVDPLFADLPMRGFASDLSLAGDPVAVLRQLTAALTGASRRPSPGLATRHNQTFDTARVQAESDGARPTITKRYLSLAIGKAVDDEVVIFNEYNLDPLLVPRRCPDSWFENSVASGLGWSLGAALGAKLAAPEKTILVTLGDGAYLFNTPLSAHLLAATANLPVLFVVFNDQAWSTIKKSTRGSHPEGWSVRTGRFPLCDFEAGVAFEKVVEACGGIGKRVEKPIDLADALGDALIQVRQGGRQVLLNVICERDG